MVLSLKNRIAFNYIITTALLIFAVFFIIYQTISYTIYSEVNDSIRYEVEEYLEQIQFTESKVKLINKQKWLLGENSELNFNPVFFELTDQNGIILEKSENLKKKQLIFAKNIAKSQFSSFKLEGNLIQQMQVPLIQNKQIKGYLIVATSLDESSIVLNNLANTLYILFPIVLIILFFVARLIAGKTMKPIVKIIDNSSVITQENLNSRIELPEKKDELYILAQTINALLDRIKEAVEREKQLTSDTSHELRTPLAVLKGTLEVLVRKPRSTAEYTEKINYCISEIDRLNDLISNMLMLARFENQKQDLKIETILLNSTITDIIGRFSLKCKNRQVTINCVIDEDYYIKSDDYLLSVILSNLISNAIKYSKPNSEVKIVVQKTENQTICTISDQGIGISSIDLEKVFNPFYRSNENNHPEIKGTGLGLSIVKRLCSILDISIEINSKENHGTTVKLTLNG